MQQHGTFVAMLACPLPRWEREPGALLLMTKEVP
jgi:hypothetical protein